MNIVEYKDFSKKFEKIEFENIPSVEEIAKNVKSNGDAAVKKYSEQFDGMYTSQLTREEIDEAYKNVDSETVAAIRYSIKNVKEFAQKQLKCIKDLKTNVEGNELGHKIVPLDVAGCYIPGGNYPLLSSAIMTIVPARVAGVKNIIACSPKIKPETIVACDLAGADKIFGIGGVQAIAAMAYGTETVDKVNKIVGPGNKYVTAAKKYVFGECGIDFLAGPSEVLIVADDSAKPELVSADMLAQCEHDLDARAFLVCFSKEFAQQVEAAALKQLKTLSTREIAAHSFEKSTAIIVNSFEQAIEISNLKAPEHLEICLKNPKTDRFTNYGSLFIGNYSAEVFGDYCSGTNHVLPTNEVAKYSGGLSIFDFIKIQTFQKISHRGVKKLAPAASQLAAKEGLSAHKLAADLRNIY